MKKRKYTTTILYKNETKLIKIIKKVLQKFCTFNKNQFKFEAA